MNYEELLRNTLIKVLRRDDIRCVWFSKTLNHAKGLYIDLGENFNYYELTFNGEEDVVYIDTYEKKSSIGVINRGKLNE